MKKVIVTAMVFCMLAVGNITCCMADDNLDICDTLGQLAEAISLAHQAGVEESDIIKKTLDSENIDQVFVIKLVHLIYKGKVFGDWDSKKLLSKKIGEGIYLECVNSLLKSDLLDGPRS